jgi:hypothetical protein
MPLDGTPQSTEEERESRKQAFIREMKKYKNK